MLERQLIEHCSPTLASIKTANLFRYVYSSREELKNCIYVWNEMLSIKGVFLEVLKRGRQDALIYVYRKEKLKEDLKKQGVCDFLKKCGYSNGTEQEILDFLKQRLQENEGFPHEIGFFFGYPKDDVFEFIVNEGKNYKFCGCWKVYTNESRAVELFNSYKKIRDSYLNLAKAGVPVKSIISAA